ncbi:MAG: nickel-responsive transcriptional regulator NikR [Planctomycetia bacterium]|nr:nickel-responsive transcriptional regulator NikR [Planctomycetia bacterium]
MGKMTRISISVDEDLLKNFDAFVAERNFPTRSEAMKNIMRDALIQEEWTKGDFVAGNISLVYDHHKPGIVQKLLDSQHDFCEEIVCSQHVHLDHFNCMEIIVLRGKGHRIREILNRLRQIKGLKNIVLTMSGVDY